MAEEGIGKILVVIKHRDDGEIVLDKAHRLAAHAEASLHVIRVVYEAFAELSVHEIEKSQELKTFFLQAEETFLEELIEPYANSAVELESATIWHKSEWQGILDVAEDCDADLIIKGTDTPGDHSVHTPSDWNLLRHTEVPVMLMKPVNWVDNPIILAAVDATVAEDENLNLRILTRARHITHALDGRLHVVNSYPSVEHWVGPITVVVDFDNVRKQASTEIEDKVNALLRKTQIEAERVHAVEGDPDVAIEQVVEETGAELVVMGTHHRAGARGMVMGNTSEKILYRVRSDVEVLH